MPDIQNQKGVCCKLIWVIDHHQPNQLSGGQRQLYARVSEQTFYLADEPTGNLDTKTSEEIMKLFNDIHEEGIPTIE
jgi:ABC-type lipoprotein export system ATPase subunit